MSRHRERPAPDTLAGDLQLVEAWRAGDAEAGAFLLERNRAAVTRFLKSRTNDPVDDLLQRVHLACRESIDRYTGQVRYQGYMIGIARNLVLKQLRESGRQPPDLDLASEAGPTPTPTGRIRSEQMRALLQQALTALPQEERSVVELYFFDDQSLPEIAERLDLPLGTVKTRKRNAQVRLRGLLAGLGAGRDEIRLTLVGLESSELETT